MFNKKNKLQHSVTLATMIMLSGLSVSAWADQYEDAAKKWAASEFKPSTLSDAEQLKELEWFIEAAKPFRGMDIKVVSETLTTHEYESKTRPRRSLKSPVSKSPMTCCRKAMSSKNCRPPCSRTRASMTAGSTTRT